jgi:tRNA (adenine37-N6)-methyltransferase
MTPTLTVIGSVCPGTRGFEIHVDARYRDGLTGLSKFSHAIVSWLANKAEASGPDAHMICPAPYTSTDSDTGVFASRSPSRPNPICLSVIAVTAIDERRGILTTPFIDALPNTPVLDIKPYFPASDRVESAHVPAHFGHWPRNLEESVTFDWAAEFR